MSHRTLQRWLPVLFAVASLALLWRAPERAEPGAAWAQGGYTPVTIEFAAGYAVQSDGAPYTEGPCVAAHVGSSLLWLRTSTSTCSSRYVAVDLSHAKSRTPDGSDPCLVSSACRTPIFTLNLCGWNTVKDFILDAQSPFRPSAATNGCQTRLQLNVERVLCNAMTLEYVRPLRVTVPSANVRVMTTDGLGEAQLLKNTGSKFVSLGYYYVPMSVKVTRLQ